MSGSRDRRRRRFISEVLKAPTATEAAIRAGYSPKTARQQASRLLTKVDIQGAVSDKERKVEEASEVTVELIRRALADMAQADPLDAFNDDGTLKPLAEIPKPVRLLLAGIELNEGQGELTKLRFSDRTKILELLGKHLRMFTELHEHTGKDGKPLPSANIKIDLSKFDDKTVLKLAGMDAA